MKDIPVFTTENGVASLFLGQIPYRGEAHIKLQSSLNPQLLLQECVEFCRACGAESIDAAGDPCLESYPLVTAVVEMSRDTEGLERTAAALFPVLPETVSQWRAVYNERMAGVSNASYMTERDEKKLLQRGNGYFVHRDGRLLGIGQAAEDTIETVASVVPGAGKDVVLALATAITQERVKLTVASTNIPAVRLYERLGFVPVRELSRWYKIL